MLSVHCPLFEIDKIIYDGQIKTLFDLYPFAFLIETKHGYHIINPILKTFNEYINEGMDLIELMNISRKHLAFTMLHGEGILRITRKENEVRTLITNDKITDDEIYDNLFFLGHGLLKIIYDTVDIKKKDNWIGRSIKLTDKHKVGISQIFFTFKAVGYYIDDEGKKKP
jgi:hypothetical protein